MLRRIWLPGLAALMLMAGCGGQQVDPTPTMTLPATAVVPALALATPTPTPPDAGTAATATAAVTPEPAAAEGVNVSPTAAPTLAVVTVSVAPGDTLLGLALDHGVPMAAIQLQNELGSSQTVRLGQDLIIPPASAWEGASPFWIVHAVSEGETLSEIAAAYGLALADLQGANGLADADLLAIGQTLVLPLTTFTEPRSVAGALAQAEPQDPTPVPTAPPDAVATPAPASAGSADAPTAPAPTATTAPPVQAGPPAVTDWPYETVRIMNEVRARHGLPPLIYNETLARAAQVQADDCAARGSCSHTGSDGSTIKERILRVGYAPASWAECWAIRPTPQEAIDIWMDEVPPNDPHRRTLLTTWLTEIGIGVAEAHWGYYFIAVFGKPR